MTVTVTLKKTASGLGFHAIVAAMEWSNVCSYIADQVENFLAQRGLDKVPRVLMATHSMGDRAWEFEVGREPAFFEEKCFNGGWYVVTEDDAKWLFCRSATSGSSLSARKDADGSWSLSLEVPVGDDQQPYQGAYWSAFHRALTPSECEAQA